MLTLHDLPRLYIPTNTSRNTSPLSQIPTRSNNIQPQLPTIRRRCRRTSSLFHHPLECSQRLPTRNSRVGGQKSFCDSGSLEFLCWGC
ncbi:uncharacterized protein RCC_04780 [Ramularia collo-cygni]|uniref:Uncharacterized protein n=1 Tax=Ramularia collo-cygni TaxID=112498 RepID=A0A2D3UX86_9PEZI|nr:uncharacterized protein RCC_04780 [Ramularia collo-cygni]CZT18935.1 uncharacterized protein RCC_04780 [Ramularia collo-cygni]